MPESEPPHPASEIVFYRTEDGRSRIQVRLEGETVWITQALMAELYQTTKQNISLHIQNIFEEGEADPAATVNQYLTVQTEGSRQVRRATDHYNLDVILAVGYRVPREAIGTYLDTLPSMTRWRGRALALGLLSIVGLASAVSGCGSSLGGATGKGGVSGGADAAATGGSGAGGAGDAGARMVWQQIFCSVSRTECSGWAEDDAMGMDGTDVNCPASNLVATSFIASICFQTPLDSTFETQDADAQLACNTWCGGTGGFQGLYPLGALATVAGSGVTCAAPALYESMQALPGQCAKTTGPSAGATEYALCNLGGRGCASMTTSSDGTEYCASMPSLTVDQSGCFDPTTTSAQDFCEHGRQFSGSTVAGTNVADEFAYCGLASATPYASPADCAATAANNQ